MSRVDTGLSQNSCTVSFPEPETFLMCRVSPVLGSRECCELEKNFTGTEDCESLYSVSEREKQYEAGESEHRD